MIHGFQNKQPSIAKTAFIAPNATIIGDVTIEDDVSIWHGVVIRGDKSKIVIKKGANIQDLTTIHGDPDFPVLIGENVTVGHGCIIHGCTVGDGTVIGMGSIVLNGAKVGAQCVVSAGSNVAGGSVLKDQQLILGAPAKAITTLGAVQLKNIEQSAQEYIDLKNLYLEQGFGRHDESSRDARSLSDACLDEADA